MKRMFLCRADGEGRPLATMMELPNYSSQLMQQLWALRKEGHFCDCTIVVGESHHSAHKLVLAASSMLFRSLLDGSDTISIDTSVVSPQEFGCLLDMVYTGKLPVGKHNVSRIVAAADSLQMFDVAVGFKNVLTSLVSQQPPPVAVHSTQTPDLSVINKLQSGNPETPADKMEERAELEEKLGREDVKHTEEPACKRACVDPPEDSEPAEARLSEEESSGSPSFRRRSSSQLVELLANTPSLVELLKRAALSGLQEEDRQVVCECCEEAEPRRVLEKLLRGVEEGLMSEVVLRKLLRAVQLEASPSSPTALLPLLEERGGKPAENAEQQNDTKEKQEDEQEAEHTERRESDEEMQADGEPEPEVSSDSEVKQEEEEGEESRTDSSSPPSSLSKPFSCRWCKKSFDYKCRLLVHSRRCSLSEEGEQQCPDCPDKLPNQRALQRHRAHTHTTAKKKVACDLCGRSFAHPSGMIYHKRTEHFEEKPFACDECGAKFGANSSLKNHKRLHTGEKPYRCKHCSMSFSVAAALAYHTKKKHSEGKMYVCQYCKAVFAQSIELTRHVRTHTGDRPYVCRECGKGYSQASGLTVHLHTFHNVSEPHDCQKCCLSFSSLEEHQQHIQDLHPKDFHRCPVCSKLLPSAALLDKHKATHTGAKPFSCDLCNKSYQQLSGLWYHNRTNHPDVFASHTRQLKTLVQCDVCFKFFPSSSSLAKHQAAQHQGPAASSSGCPYCPVVLGGAEELQEHLSSHHLSESSAALCCPLCSAPCCSLLELQGHLLAQHTHTQQEEEEAQEQPEQQVSTSYTVISAEPSGVREEGAEPAVSAQHLLVALSGGAELNMYDLLNSSVTFICEDKAASADSEP